jgi:alanine-synthesizing transaminase
MGNPDMPTPKHIVDKLIETARDPRSNRYSASRGIRGLRKAYVGYYQRRFGVTLDPESEVIAALGSKEGFANLAQAITAPGDVVLVPNPAYPIHSFGFILAGAAIRHVPATSPEEYLSRLGNAVRHSVPSPVALVVNYPSNPTAHVVDLDFYKEVVAFAKKHEIWVLSDLAYADIYFDDDHPPPSILQVDGGKDVAIEFQSLSKTYAMPGWRMGFAAGNRHLIGALGRIKSYLDYGAYTPIQVAAAAALNGPQNCVAEIRAMYKSRRDVLVETMHRAGWNIPAPAASMFAWAPVPDQYRERGSMEFAKQLLVHAKVAVSPGIGFGEYGEGYVRVALVENEHRIRQAARNVKKFLSLRVNEPDVLEAAK